MPPLHDRPLALPRPDTIFGSVHTATHALTVSIPASLFRHAANVRGRTDPEHVAV